MPVQLFDADDRITVKDSDLPGIEKGDPETTYTVRPLDTPTHASFVKLATIDKGYDRRTHQRIKELDAVRLSEDLIDFVLEDWTGVVRKGQPVPCVKENKVRLDAARKGALLEVAGINQIVTDAAEVREESFRQTAD